MRVWAPSTTATTSDSRTAYDALSLRSDKLGSVMRAFMEILGPNDMMAYLAMMAPRLVELRRALKPAGSIYLLCDPICKMNQRKDNANATNRYVRSA